MPFQIIIGVVIFIAIILFLNMSLNTVKILYLVYDVIVSILPPRYKK